MLKGSETVILTKEEVIGLLKFMKADKPVPVTFYQKADKLGVLKLLLGMKEILREERNV